MSYRYLNAYYMLTINLEMIWLAAASASASASATLFELCMSSKRARTNCTNIVMVGWSNTPVWTPDRYLDNLLICYTRCVMYTSLINCVYIFHVLRLAVKIRPKDMAFKGMEWNVRWINEWAMTYFELPWRLLLQLNNKLYALYMTLKDHWSRNWFCKVYTFI